MQMLLGSSDYVKKEFVMAITAIWLFALWYTVMIWGKSIHIERVEKNVMEKLKLESVQNEIFMNFLSSISPSKKFSKLDFMKYLARGLNEEQKNSPKEFAKLNFVDNLVYYLVRWPGKRIMLHFEPEDEIVQNMADIILLRAKEHEIIKTFKSYGLIECYEIIQDESV